MFRHVNDIFLVVWISRLIGVTTHGRMHVRRQFENNCLRPPAIIDCQVVGPALVILRACICCEIDYCSLMQRMLAIKGNGQLLILQSLKLFLGTEVEQFERKCTTIRSFWYEKAQYYMYNRYVFSFFQKREDNIFITLLVYSNIIYSNLVLVSN